MDESDTPAPVPAPEPHLPSAPETGLPVVPEMQLSLGFEVNICPVPAIVSEGEGLVPEVSPDAPVSEEIPVAPVPLEVIAAALVGSVPAAEAEAEPAASVPPMEEPSPSPGTAPEATAEDAPISLEETFSVPLKDVVLQSPLQPDVQALPAPNFIPPTPFIARKSLEEQKAEAALEDPYLKNLARRRKMVKALFGATIGGAMGYFGHPWIAGDRRDETALAAKRLLKRLHEGGPTVNYVSRDEHEPPTPYTAQIEVRPVELDTHGKAYEAFLASLGLRFIQPIELLRPHFNVRGHVANSLPPRELWRNMAPTLKAADALRQQLGVSLLNINSAYRSPAYNARCPGAAKHSYHVQNQALDLVYDCPPEKVAKAAEALRAKGVFRGGIGRYPGFTHIDTRGRNADWG